MSQISQKAIYRGVRFYSMQDPVESDSTEGSSSRSQNMQNIGESGSTVGSQINSTGSRAVHIADSNNTPAMSG